MSKPLRRKRSCDGSEVENTEGGNGHSKKQKPVPAEAKTSVSVEVETKVLVEVVYSSHDIEGNNGKQHTGVSGNAPELRKLLTHQIFILYQSNGRGCQFERNGPTVSRRRLLRLP
eukprot:gb/GEZN01024602.1/.p1 GENE.gb/GEZN01024602.1/~~gb/GEZN01024602.1/.p1  ORF type:complete len:115 (+),score=6.78 gb/GEZN01024602.1/:30-374(+)